jgi:type IV secretion system protein TrbL
VLSINLGGFTTYIDRRSGLRKPKVAFIASTLIMIDIMLRLYSGHGCDHAIVARLAKKTLIVGVFGS